MIFRTPLEGIEHPVMEADVIIVGGGPAGMACALRLSQLIDAHNAAHPDAPLSKENIYVLEKARELGQHSLCGALLDPRSMDELLPGWKDGSAHRGRSDQRSGLLPDPQVEVQGSHHSASAAGSRQLRHLAQPLRQVAGLQGRGDRHHRLHRLCRQRAAARRRQASPACAPTTRAWTSRTSPSRISSPATT